MTCGTLNRDANRVNLLVWHGQFKLLCAVPAENTTQLNRKMWLC